MKEGINRREFLSGGLTAAAFIAELSLPKKVAAELEGLIGLFTFFKESYDQSLGRLRGEVFESPVETFWAYIKKGETRGLLDIQNPLKTTVRSVSSINLMPLYQDKGIEEIIFLHTHPVENYKERYFRNLIPKATIGEAITQKKTNFPLIPSGEDFVAALRGRLFMEERKINQIIRYVVAEPSGVWTYDIDPANSRIRSFFDEEAITSRSVHKNKKFSNALAQDIRNRQSRFYREGGITEKNFAEFQKWAQHEWGIKISYQTF